MAISELLVALLVIFAAAKLFGELAERIGQPAVLGEMVGGIVVGVSGLHLIDAHDPVLHLLAELGASCCSSSSAWRPTSIGCCPWGARRAL